MPKSLHKADMQTLFKHLVTLVGEIAICIGIRTAPKAQINGDVITRNWESANR